MRTLARTAIAGLAVATMIGVTLLAAIGDRTRWSALVLAYGDAAEAQLALSGGLRRRVLALAAVALCGLGLATACAVYGAAELLYVIGHRAGLLP